MFGHLQIKSAYSFKESTILIKDLINEAKRKNIDALALCDQDNMFGTFEFYKRCIENHIKPIIGVEATILIDDEKYPFTLLAIDDKGYYDLVKIVSYINLDENKCMPISMLKKYKDHLLIISSSQEGLIERLILKDMELMAEKYLRKFKEVFNDHYYIMIQNHNIALTNKLNERLIAIANYLNIKVICSNDVCYLEKEDALAIDLMKASKNNEVLPLDYMPKTNEKYLKTEDEMNILFSKEIINNTKEVINLCKASIAMNQKNLPEYKVKDNINTKDYLKELCKVGLKKRFKGKTIDIKYIERLNYELEMIHKMGFDDYFLIVWDYVAYAKKNKILVGPGRGSAAGSLVAYVLGITNIDPIQYDLLFERFLNPERVSMPDIDIDFQDDRRDEVVSYVLNKYGQQHVCQIVTFNTYGPRVAIKDIGKVMGIPLARLEIVAKMVPTDLKNKKTITQMYQTSASFQKYIRENQGLVKILRSISVIEHLPKNISTHPAGVVLSARPLDESVPLVLSPSHVIMSQYSKDYIEDAGLLKMDFLGLRNLTMISYILKDIENNTHVKISLNDIPYNDKKTYDMISKAETFGVFQLESYGMRQLLLKLKPYKFDDIVAAIALFRPGPMENIPTYLQRREDTSKISYITPSLKPILENTSGIIIYQEQIMQIAQVIAGFSLGKADMIRKAVSKKNLALMEDMKDDFIKGAIHNGYSTEVAIEIFDLIERFANYGFNKSHSVAYGVIAYQLAYLKANYPLYFFASILSNQASNSKIKTIEEAKSFGIKILKPSVNYSSSRFMVYENGIRFSLTAIKNVGQAGYLVIKKVRENGLFKDIFDFFSRIENERISSKMLDSLIDAGALDEFGYSRKLIKENKDTLLEYVHLKNTIGVDEKPILKDVKEDLFEKLENEKEVLGLYISTHPLAIIKNKLNIQIVDLRNIENYINQTINILVSVNRLKTILDKRGNEMAFIEGGDDSGNVDCVCFSNQYKMLKDTLHKNKTYVMEVNVRKRDTLSVIINKVKEVK